MIRRVSSEPGQGGPRGAGGVQERSPRELAAALAALAAETEDPKPRRRRRPATGSQDVEPQVLERVEKLQSVPAAAPADAVGDAEPAAEAEPVVEAAPEPEHEPNPHPEPQPIQEPEPVRRAERVPERTPAAGATALAAGSGLIAGSLVDPADDRPRSADVRVPRRSRAGTPRRGARTIPPGRVKSRTATKATQATKPRRRRAVRGGSLRAWVGRHSSLLLVALAAFVLLVAAIGAFGSKAKNKAATTPTVGPAPASPLYTPTTPTTGAVPPPASAIHGRHHKAAAPRHHAPAPNRHAPRHHPPLPPPNRHRHPPPTRGHRAAASSSAGAGTSRPSNTPASSNGPTAPATSNASTTSASSTPGSSEPVVPVRSAPAPPSNTSSWAVGPKPRVQKTQGGWVKTKSN
jgi:hypothetical protein